MNRQWKRTRKGEMKLVERKAGKKKNGEKSERKRD